MTARAPAPTSPSLADELPEEVRRAKGGDALAPVTVVAPTAYAAVAARRRLALASRGRVPSGIANVSCTTLGKLRVQLAAPGLAQRGLRIAAPSVEAEAVRAVAAGDPERWARLAGHPATLAAVQRAFAELRRSTVPALEALARREARGAEVVSLLLAVRRQLHDAGLADALDAHDEAVAALSAAEVPLELGAVVVMAGAVEGPADRGLLAALSARVSWSELPAPPVATATERWACADPEEEARAAVRLVLAGAEEGVALWRQGVFHPAGPGYGRLLHQHLAAAGIAVFGPELRRLDGTGAGRALLGLLELAGSDWPRNQVMAWLASAPLLTGPGGRPVPVSRWNALSADAGVVRGIVQWRTRLERLAGRQPADAADALSLAEFVEGLADGVPTGRLRWSAWGAWAVDQLGRYVDDDVATAWPPEQRLALAQVADVAASLRELEAVVATTDLPGFRRAVRAELERHRVDLADLPSGGVGDGVFVAPFDQAVGMHFHTAVLVGMADANVAGRAGDDALLPDELRALDASGALPTRAARQQQTAAEVAAALGTGSHRRVVVHPAVDPRTGRVQMPSRLLEELAPPPLAVHRVDSLAASLRGAGPALSLDELRLRTLDAWADAGLDPATSPPARLDPRLRTGMVAARSRLGHHFTRFDGLVGAGRVSPFDPAHPVSATRFEVYAECPRKFLFERVLGIERRTLPEDLWRIEARDRGSLVHAVLERYVAERIEGAPRSLERLLAICEEHLDEATAGGMVGKALLWRMDRAAIRRDLHLFFAEEGDLEPLAVELSFGNGEDDVPAVAVALADGRHVRFRGRADRVDRDAEGTLVVSDYKTGKQTGISKLSGDPLDGGKRLQLPLYALAARTAFGWNGPVTARYWMVSSERAAARYHLELTAAVERHFGEVVARIARGVDAGCFPAIPGSPRDVGFEGCMWCDFDVVCPATRDRQWTAKRDDPELAPVADLLDVEAPEPLPGLVVRSLPEPPVSP
jgi:RecB family exonuclease